MDSRERKYQTLVHGHSAALYRYAWWLCDGDAATAEDIVQDTFLRAWRALDQLEDAAAAKAWLMTILRRENARRFERKRFDFADVELDRVADDGLTLDTELDRHELQRGMLRLEPMYRDPLLLQTLGGFSCEEIAQIMDIGRGAVMTRLFRAKKMLAEDIAPDQEQRHG